MKYLHINKTFNFIINAMKFYIHWYKDAFK